MVKMPYLDLNCFLFALCLYFKPFLLRMKYNVRIASFAEAHIEYIVRFVLSMCRYREWINEVVCSVLNRSNKLDLDQHFLFRNWFRGDIYIRCNNSFFILQTKMFISRRFANFLGNYGRILRHSLVLKCTDWFTSNVHTISIK